MTRKITRTTVRGFLLPYLSFAQHIGDEIYSKILIRDGKIQAFNKISFLSAPAPFDTEGHEVLIPTTLYYAMGWVDESKTTIKVHHDGIVLKSDIDDIRIQGVNGESFVVLPEFPDECSEWRLPGADIPFWACDRTDYVKFEKEATYIINKSYIVDIPYGVGVAGPFSVKNSEMKKAASIGVISKFAITGKFIMLKSSCFTIGIPRMIEPYHVDVEEIKEKIKETSFSQIRVNLSKLREILSILSKISTSIELSVSESGLELTARGPMVYMKRVLECDSIEGTPGKIAVSSRHIARIMEIDPEVTATMFLSESFGLIVEGGKFNIIVPSYYLDSV